VLVNVGADTHLRKYTRRINKTLNYNVTVSEVRKLERVSARLTRYIVYTVQYIPVNVVALLRWANGSL
jgi:hypothetical protein